PIFEPYPPTAGGAARPGPHPGSRRGGRNAPLFCPHIFRTKYGEVLMTTMTPNVEFSILASDERVAATTAALEANGFRTIDRGTGDEARRVVLELLPPGAEVFDATSRTLESIGLAEEIEQSG